MTKFALFGVATILSSALATPVLAHVALAPCFRPSMAGKETTTRPWSAPVGHRQPRAADVRTSVLHYDLDQEDADVDRKFSGVCRGC
jgi:hypothetical protein